MSSLTPSSLMSKQKGAMKNKVTSNFIIFYKSAKPTEASICLCGLQPHQSTSPLKWTLLIKYCSASLPMSCQSPHDTKKIRIVQYFYTSKGFLKNGLLIRLYICCVFACLQRPSDNTINGVLTGYRLYYRELPVNTSSFTEAEVQATKNNTTSALITGE